jgi:hypothetical protein
MQVDHGWAVSGRHHVDQTPRRACDELSLRVGGPQHPAVHLFDRGSVPRRRSGMATGPHALTIRPAKGIA